MSASKHDTTARLSVVEENERLKQEIARLKDELATDDLTGLYSARHFRDRLEECVDEMWRRKVQPALLFIDIDHFKSINEAHGHAAAGRVLRQVGRLIATLIRVDDMAFRYGGDEFVVLVSGGIEGARGAGERIRAAIESYSFGVRGLQGVKNVALTVSVGVRAFCPGDSTERILEDADRAMFEAKRRSRNTVVAA